MGSRREQSTRAEELQRSLHRLLERADSIDIGSHEGRDRVDLERELVPALEALLADSASALSAVREHYNTGNTTATRNEEVSELAAIALWEVRQRLQILSTARDDAGAVLAGCARAHRVLFKSAIAVERAICEREGFARKLDTLSNVTLHRSLRIRRHYSAFGKEIGNEPFRDGEHLLVRFGRALESLERLEASSIYRDLRITDRAELARIRAKVESWLDGKDGRDLLSGGRLWQDLTSFSELLRQINNREVLREHDAHVINSARRALFEKLPWQTHVAEAILIRLRSVWGRDDELDRLIETADELDPSRWQSTLKRLSRSSWSPDSRRRSGDDATECEEAESPATPVRRVTIRKMDEECKKLLGGVGGALACGVVDLHTGLPLGMHNAFENTEVRHECLAAAAAELFGGPGARTFPWLGQPSPGVGHDGLVFEEAYVASRSTCQFARTIRNGDALIVLVTRRAASLGMTSGFLRAAIPSVEALVP